MKKNNETLLRKAQKNYEVNQSITEFILCVIVEVLFVSIIMIRAELTDIDTALIVISSISAVCSVAAIYFRQKARYYEKIVARRRKAAFLD